MTHCAVFQYFEHIEEMVWAIEVCKEKALPVAATMCIGPEGDLHGVATGECAIQMAMAGQFHISVVSLSNAESLTCHKVKSYYYILTFLWGGVAQWLEHQTVK